jgi:hypothetical protein
MYADSRSHNRCVSPLLRQSVTLQPKKHDQWFPQPVFGLESGLMFISFFDADVVVSILNI